MQNYQRLFWANQERSDKMNSVYNSAGYHSMKSGGGSDDSDILLDAVEAYKAGTMTENDQVSVLLIVVLPDDTDCSYVNHMICPSCVS